MTIKQRIWDIVISAVIIFASIAMMMEPEYGVVLAAAIFAVAMIVTGIRYLFYYLTMAKYMVGGKVELIISILILDFGTFIASVILGSPEILIFFLQIFYGAYGVIDIVVARQSKKAGSPLWKLNMISGFVNIGFMVTAFICGNFYQSNTLLVYIFCLGLIYMAIVRIVTAFRKTAVVYIQ